MTLGVDDNDMKAGVEHGPDEVGANVVGVVGPYGESLLLGRVHAREVHDCGPTLRWSLREDQRRRTRSGPEPEVPCAERGAGGDPVLSARPPATDHAARTRCSPG